MKSIVISWVEGDGGEWSWRVEDNKSLLGQGWSSSAAIAAQQASLVVGWVLDSVTVAVTGSLQPEETE